MSHHEVLNLFLSFFPREAMDMLTWFPNGKNSIRIRLNDGQDYVFTINNKKNWRFETIDSFIERSMKGGKS